MEFNHIAAWTFVSETSIPKDVAQMLVPGEEAIAAYKTIRDQAIFTTKRLIVRDAQGLTGKKVEVYSLPYSAVNMWSSENAGTFDFNAEIRSSPWKWCNRLRGCRGLVPVRSAGSASPPCSS
ncbi:PH domain-containing protein, partial [Micrococcus luteus]